MTKFWENTALKINSIKDDFKTVVDIKLEKISEVQVYLLNATENLQ